MASSWDHAKPLLAAPELLVNALGMTGGDELVLGAVYDEGGCGDPSGCNFGGDIRRLQVVLEGEAQGHGWQQSRMKGRATLGAVLHHFPQIGKGGEGGDGLAALSLVTCELEGDGSALRDAKEGGLARNGKLRRNAVEKLL